MPKDVPMEHREVAVVTKEVSKKHTMNVSAYTAHEGGSMGAWDNELSIGDCASDDLPRGTVVVLPNGDVLTVADKFGGGYKDRLDIYYGWDLDGAMEFGRRTMEVEVVQ